MLHGTPRFMAGVPVVMTVAKIARRPHRGFYLCPRPVAAGPEAHGDADLPPPAVRVTVPSAARRRLASAPGRVEVIGRLVSVAKHHDGPRQKLKHGRYAPRSARALRVPLVFVASLRELRDEN
jgi:hypothetical protein